MSVYFEYPRITDFQLFPAEDEVSKESSIEDHDGQLLLAEIAVVNIELTGSTMIGMVF
ncbi:hypothetical protein [Pedobacter sp. SYP-B3415]|uniref:hypothetical protein n=1 Tax=Pedobacter sp. SYP-B3415 TaxID=2496641 RepID=UPI0013ECA002|nr:hypothetical protein [Pedobacter sp. SYP-B3415]